MTRNQIVENRVKFGDGVCYELGTKDWHRIVSVTKCTHFGDEKPRVEINWSAIGSVDIAIATQFSAMLQRAIEIARSI